MERWICTIVLLEISGAVDICHNKHLQEEKMKPLKYVTNLVHIPTVNIK